MSIHNEKDLNSDFIFSHDAYNMRSTELNAVLALNQLPRLDANNLIRKQNLDIFLNTLDSKKFYTEFNRDGNSNYAFTLLLRDQNMDLRDRIELALKTNAVEFRRGMSGGGNQLRQPYLRGRFEDGFAKKFPNCEHVHFFGWYIGNYPELDTAQILELTTILNKV